LLGLIFERFGSPIPKEAAVIAGVHQTGSVAIERLAIHAERRGATIAPTEIGIVAGGARHLPAAREPRVEEKHLAEFGLRRRVRIVGGVRDFGEEADLLPLHAGVDRGRRPRR
jgi:hypothetical protein